MHSEGQRSPDTETGFDGGHGYGYGCGTAWGGLHGRGDGMGVGITAGSFHGEGLGSGDVRRGRGYESACGFG